MVTGWLSLADFDALALMRRFGWVGEALQAKKQEKIVHPFLGEEVEIGLLPYIQAMLLARHLRGDLAEYPPFLMR